MEVVRNGSCPGRNFPGWELFGVRDVRGEHYPGWEISRVGVARGESCAGRNCPRWELSSGKCQGESIVQ